MENLDKIHVIIPITRPSNKEDNQGTFYITCRIGPRNINKALCDPTAGINILSYKEYEQINAGEMKDIGYYADDATSFYQNRPPLVGKPAIVEFLKSDLNANSNKISFTTNDVFVSSDGNQVVEVGYFKVIDSANTAINTGNYMSLFEKRDGKYVSVRDMSASDMPLK